jgi:ribosomal protein L37AE/L43A
MLSKILPLSVNRLSSSIPGYVSSAASLRFRERYGHPHEPGRGLFGRTLVEDVMELRANRPAVFARSRPTLKCAQCGEQLFVPEWSEYLDTRRVRHLWHCEHCGYDFETTIRFAAA